MARYISSESDDYYQPPPRQRHHSQTNDDRVYRLTSNLQDTSKNLQSLDRMLSDYTDVGRDKKSAIERIRGDLGRTHEDIRDERARSNVIDRDYGSDSENYGTPSGHHRHRRRTAVRFADDMNRELHSIHQSVRDISSEQLKLEESFSKDMDRRDRYETDTRRSLRDINDAIKSSGTDPLSARVEKRLQTIQSEIKAEQGLLSNRRGSDDIAALSNELRQAIHSSQTQNVVDDKMRSQYLQSESLRHRIESELDGVKRRLDQTEGSKMALHNQVEQLKAQLSRAEQDRQRMRLDLDESRIETEVKERRRKRNFEDDRNRALEQDLLEMKTHLVRSVGAVSEMEELRRRLEKSERQRTQLSDHIETLAKDLENRERQSAKVITQLKEVSDKYDDSERHRSITTTQLEDIHQKLKDVTRELERTTHELRNTQLSLTDTEKKKDEFKGRAQETVRQWKAKVKQLERDLDRQKHGNGQMMARHEQLVKEMEGQKQHGTYSQLQLEGLKRELADALAVRAAQDEQIRLKDIEVNELKSFRMDLDREYRDSRTIADKLENELHSLRSKSATLSEDKHRLEDKLSAVEAAHLLAQDQSHSLQDDLKELSRIKADIASQFAETTAKNHDLRQAVVELQHREKAAKDEADLYKKQLYQERNGLNKNYETLKQELNEAKVREAHTLQEVQRKFRANNAETDATIQALKMELSEEKSNSKILCRNADRLKDEMAVLEKRLKMSEEENASLRRKMELVKNEFEAQSQLAEDDLNRVCRLESQLSGAHVEMEKLEKQQINLVQEIAIELDALVETASVDATSKCQPINGLKNLVTGRSGIPNLLLTEIKNKLKWLRSEFRERLARERRLRNEFRIALSSSEVDRKFLIGQLARKDEELDDLALEKQEIAYKEIQNQSFVEELEDQVLDLSDELQLRKIREDEQRKMFAREKQNIIEEMEDIMDAEKEKAKIEDRYRRLQDTLKSLHQDLKTTKIEKGKERMNEQGRPTEEKAGNDGDHEKKNKTEEGEITTTSQTIEKTNGILRSPSPNGTPKKRNHVRISSNTPTKEFDADEPVVTAPCHTPPPMALTDDEFRSKFLPQTPDDIKA